MPDRPIRATARSLFLMLALPALSGCAALTGPPQGKLFERDGVSMVAVPSGSRETYFSDPGARERHCRSPSPDVSFTASEGASFSAPGVAKGVGGSEDASRGALSLGGRDPAVLIAREMLYRTCELTNNLGLSQEQALKLYRDVLQVLVKISATQTSAGAAPTQAQAASAAVTAPAVGSAPAAGSASSGGSGDASATSSDSGSASSSGASGDASSTTGTSGSGSSW